MLAVLQATAAVISASGADGYIEGPSIGTPINTQHLVAVLTQVQAARPGETRLFLLGASVNMIFRGTVSTYCLVRATLGLMEARLVPLSSVSDTRASIRHGPRLAWSLATKPWVC